MYNSEKFIRGMHIFAPPFPDDDYFRVHPDLGPGEVVDGTIRYFFSPSPPFFLPFLRFIHSLPPPFPPHFHFPSLALNQ